MPHSTTRAVGRDGHHESMAVASVAPDHGAEVVSRGAVGTRPCGRDTRLRPRQAKSHHRVFVDAAGPCGDGRWRDLTHTGQVCRGVAPSLMPTTAGERVTTDRRDAGPWARRMRAGDLTPVDVPQVADDALRDLSRARADAIGALKAATCRLNACWLRHAIRSTGQATWGPAPLRGLSAVGCPTPAPPIVLQADVRAVTEPTARLPRLAHARHDPVTSWRLHPVVDARQAVRGVPLLVAVTTGAARGDRPRVDTPRARLRCLGLIPSASARGERRRQGALPTAGHTPARRARSDGARASRDPAQVSRHLPRRLAQPSNVIQDIRGKTHVRRGQRDRPLSARGPHAHPVVVAMARELGGFLGAMATQVPVTPDG